jgi:hypothetical protein
VPEPSTGGFDHASKQLVVQCLRRLERTCRWGPGQRQLGVTGGRLVAKARVPVLKLQLGCGTELDVSLNDDGGIKAARFLKSFVSVVLWAFACCCILLHDAGSQKCFATLLVCGSRHRALHTCNCCIFTPQGEVSLLQLCCINLARLLDSVSLLASGLKLPLCVASYCLCVLHLQQQDFSAVRPLTLLLKCILKQRGLSEVFTGGLGSWSLVNMVIAHLMVRMVGVWLLLSQQLYPAAVGDGVVCVVFYQLPDGRRQLEPGQHDDCTCYREVHTRW